MIGISNRDDTIQNFLKNFDNKVKDFTNESLLEAFEKISNELFINRKYTSDIDSINNRLNNNENIIPITVNFATKKYDIFKIFDINRDTVYSNKENVKESILKTNCKLTKYNPIIIDKEYTILDGQHRRLALSEIDKPVIFTIGNDIDENDIKHINTQKALTMNDWLRHNIKIKVYYDFNNMMEKYGISSVTTAQKLFLNTTNSERFKLGEVNLSNNIDINIDRVEKIEKLYQFIMINKELIDIRARQGLKNNFIKVVFDLFDTPNFSYNKFYNKARDNGIELFGVSKLDDIRNKLVKMYNTGLNKRNKIIID